MLVLAGLLAAADSPEPRTEFGLTYLISTIAALQLALGVGGRVRKGSEELPGSRQALRTRLAVWRPVTALALLVLLAQVARRNGFGSAA